MTNAPRKMVNIVSQCESWLVAAQAEHSEIVKQLGLQDAVLKDAQSSNNQVIADIEKKITFINSTMKAVIGEGGDASSLEKKRAEMESRLADAQSNPEFATKVAMIESGITELTKKSEAAAAVVAEKAKQLDIAKHLAASFDLDDSYGAKEAPEYETLAEAAEDYAMNIRFDVGIVGTQVEKVVFWQVPEAATPDIYDVAAQPGQKYLIKALPTELDWVKDFRDYSGMPKTNGQDFDVGDSRFISVESLTGDDKLEAEGAKLESSPDMRPAWLSTFTAPSRKTLYYPDESLTRSGLCYVRETSKFYSIQTEKFECATKKTKREFKRVGYEHREVDVDYVEKADFDASFLLLDLFTHAYPLIEQASKEMGSLQSAKSGLAVKIREAICSVADTSNLFVVRNQRLDAREINTEVGAYWEAFVSAPWDYYVHGDCALLKHLCERKLETPHVYSFPFKGHYGLRVRTRDHSWIFARLFCPPDALCPKEPIKPNDVVYLTDSRGRCTSHVRIGPCCLWIYST